MRYFFDAEFDEDGKTIELISIGIIAEDGREYYAVSSEFDPTHCNPWVKEHVLPFLGPGPRLRRAVIAAEVRNFVRSYPEWWSYYPSYDWVALCQLYGTMMDLPPTWPKAPLDIRQLAHDRGIAKSLLPRESEDDLEHNALGGARYHRAMYDFIAAQPR